MNRDRRMKFDFRMILPLLLVGGFLMFVRRNRTSQMQAKRHRMRGQHTPMDYDSRQKLQRQVEILEEADNRMFDAFPQD